MENNKQTTALQQAILDLKKQKDIYKNHFEEGKWNSDRCEEIDNCISILESKLELEKQQIIDAWGSDRQFIIYDSDKDELSQETINELSEQYYTDTYGND